MIASFQHGQFRIVEAFSRIVRLGEDLSRTGELKAAAQDRAIAALAVCAAKLKRRPGMKLRAVATQACRAASNGPAFIERVERETGIKLQMITSQEEAHLSVAGCASLLEGIAGTAMVLDVGGGSTELAWVDLSHLPAPDRHSAPRPVTQSQTASQASGNATNLKSGKGIRPHHWLSIPIGVVNLSERFPEPKTHTHPEGASDWFQSMVDDVKHTLTSHQVPEVITEHFRQGRAYIIGTSGAITSLAGMHLGLERYDRSRVDGLWLNSQECRGVIDRLLQLGAHGRELEPCIGKDRADLVLAGAAILEAVQSLWPSERLRVADRGLREGLLMSMVRKKSRRRRSRTKAASPAA
jgi:exopolyphosphatase / guanosine-5'-triphosphate,3'-diphosphate pyrophosphatase